MIKVKVLFKGGSYTATMDDMQFREGLMPMLEAGEITGWKFVS